MFITVCGQKGGVAKTCTSVHLASVWDRQGKNVCIVDADKNRSALAYASRGNLPFPVFPVSAALLNTLSADIEPSIYLLAKKIASSGFADTSRVGGGNPELGVSMAKFNKKNIERHLASYRHSLDLFEKYLLEENWSELEKILVNTQEERQNFI